MTNEERVCRLREQLAKERAEYAAKISAAEVVINRLAVELDTDTEEIKVSISSALTSIEEIIKGYKIALEWYDIHVEQDEADLLRFWASAHYDLPWNYNPHA